MLDNCKPDSRLELDFDGPRIHVVHSCGGFTSDVGRDGIENDRTHCEGVFIRTYDVREGQTSDTPPFTQQQWEAEKVHLEQIANHEYVRLAGPDPETGDRVEKEYGFIGDETFDHLS